jgi:hypothetical protein
MSPKKIPSLSNPYTLRYRFSDHNGNWTNWSTGFGEWMGIEHVQSQIRMLAKSKKHRQMEIEIKYQGRYLNYIGTEIDGSIIYK